MNLRTGVSPLQFFIIVINSAFGAGMLTLPRSVADAAKEDMWLSVVLGGVVFLFSFWAVVKVSQYFPQHTCIEYHRILLGPILGQALNIALLFLMVMLTGLALRGFGIALKIMLFDLTPPQIAVAVLLLLAVYAIQYGLAPLMRFQQFIFMHNYLLFMPLVLLGLMSVDTKQYLPMLAKGFTPVLKGAMPSWFSYSGPELVTGLIYPFVTRQNHVFKWGAAGIGMLTLLYTLLTLIVQGILGSRETAYMQIPTISAYREVEIPDTFIERLDGYLMILWIPLYFISLANFFYFISFGTARLFKLENSRPFVVLLAPVIYYMANLPPDAQTLADFNKLFNIADMAWGLGILPLLTGIAWLKKKRRNTC